MSGWKRKAAIAASVGGVVVLALGVVAGVPPLRFAVLRTVLPLTETLSVAPLRGGAYWVSGGIGNTGFVVGASGVVAIDAQMFVPTTRKELEEIRRITAKPVDTVILTHSDPDHINGLPAFASGIGVIAQENAAREIRRVIAEPASNGFPPPPEIARYAPTKVVKDREEALIDGVPMVLLHTAPAHTDGDLAVYLPAQRIVFAGDLLTPAIGPYPGIHLDKHGSSLGWIASMKAILALDADLYVPGHGDMLPKDELARRLAAAERRRAEIKALFDQGRSLEEARATLKDVALKGLASRFPTFVETTYQELAAEQATPASAPK